MTSTQEEFATLGIALMGLGLAVGFVYVVEKAVGGKTLGRRAEARRAGSGSS